jgi:hypothetical protein
LEEGTCAEKTLKNQCIAGPKKNLWKNLSDFSDGGGRTRMILRPQFSQYQKTGASAGGIQNNR